MADTKFFTDGEAYEKLMGRWSRAAGEQFIDWLALPKELNWVDVGCGTGAFTELALDRCAPKQISAVDPSADQIAYAKSRPAASRVAYRVGDAMALPYPDGEFDIGTMALVIVFVPDPAKATIEVARVVKPGGTVATYMWDLLGGGFVQEPLRKAIRDMGISVSENPGNANSRVEALKSYFEAAGVEQIATRRIDIEVSYANFDDYWTAQTALTNTHVAPIRKMPPPDVERLKAMLRERLTTKNGRIAYPAWANAIKGRVPA